MLSLHIDPHKFVVSLIAFIVLLGIMVIVHEFGHFIVAKLFRVRVEAFSFGFGPRLFGFKHGDTDYKVCLLPLGGYVKMTGETPDNLQQGDPDLPTAASAEDPGSFLAHPRWQRMLIGVAGPTANFILAFFLMLGYFAFINEVPAVEVGSTSVEWISDGSAAAAAGLQPGDQIIALDGQQNPEWEKIYARLKLNADQTIQGTALRAGQPFSFSLHVPASAKEDDFSLSDAGLMPVFQDGPISVVEVNAGTPADQAGLKPGDAIASVDGHAFHSVSSLIAYMQEGQGKAISLGIDRGQQHLSLIAHPAKLDTGFKLGFSSVPPRYKTSPLGLTAGIHKSRVFCQDNSLLIVEVLKRVFTRRVAVSQLSGPVGIARMAGEAAEMNGWLPKYALAAQISLNLGILNLLPFPILDGGLILFLLIESAIRRDISIVVKERVYQVAFVLILAFFAFIIFNDVSKLGLFTHAKP